MSDEKKDPPAGTRTQPAPSTRESFAGIAKELAQTADYDREEAILNELWSAYESGRSSVATKPAERVVVERRRSYDMDDGHFGKTPDSDDWGGR